MFTDHFPSSKHYLKNYCDWILELENWISTICEQIIQIIFVNHYNQVIKKIWLGHESEHYISAVPHKSYCMTSEEFKM